MPRIPGLVAAIVVLVLPRLALAGDMDPALSRLVFAAGKGPCPAGAAFCPDNQAFEYLASELAVAMSPAISTPAASGGARGFYLGISSAITPIRAGERYWAKGTRGSSLSANQNNSVDSALSINRVSVRKGLPFGLEIGSSLGFGAGTSLWVLSGELRVVLFEGFRSGLGALPDVALRGATQATFGSSELSLRTNTLDVTLSKPFVLAQVHRLTPLLALQALFIQARSGRIDLTPGTNAFTSCASDALQSNNGVELSCPTGSAADLANNATFHTVNQTRVRLFVGAEERYSLLSVAATLGIDLTVPQVQNFVPADDLPDHLMRQVSFQLACGLRY